MCIIGARDGGGAAVDVVRIQMPIATIVGGPPRNVALASCLASADRQRTLRISPGKLDSRPGADVALTLGVVPCADDCAVGTQAKGVRGTGRHGDDAAPIADFALSAAVIAGRKDPPGRRDPHGVVTACAQRHYVFPLIDVARSGCPVSGRNGPPVASEADGVEISGCNGGEVTPAFNGGLPPPIGPHGQC